MKLFGSKISKEEHNKLKQALEQTNKQLTEKVKVLEGSNTKLTEEKGTLVKEKESIQKEFDTFKTQHRKDVISALHSGCQLKSEDALSWSIDSYAKSNMTFEEIKLILDQLRCAKVPIHGIQEFPGIK